MRPVVILKRFNPLRPESRVDDIIGVKPVLERRNVTASLGFGNPCLDLLLDGRVHVHTTMMDMHRSAACAVSAAVGTPDTGGWTGS